MAKIAVSDILADFKMMWQEHWAYGSEIKRGQVDCSGAFVWSYQQHGCNIYHGSNRIARTEVSTLIPIKVAKLVPGMVIFKSKEPPTLLNLNGYSLPDSYKKGGAYYNGDLLDYYHIGLVAEDTKYVYNAQDTANGFVRTEITKGKWSHAAYLKQVDYGMTSTKTELPDISKTAEKLGKAIVKAASGSSVKMRKTPSKNESVYWNIPLNATVDILEESKDGWTKIRSGGREGYMMSEFLEMKG